jgi:hypothetical protein
MRSARSVPSFCRGRIPQFLPALRAGWVGGDEWRAPFERYAADIIAIAAAKRGPAGAQVSRPAGLTLRLEGTKLVNLRRCGDFPTFDFLAIDFGQGSRSDAAIRCVVFFVPAGFCGAKQKPEFDPLPILT